VHVASAYRPQPSAGRALARREDHERITSLLGAADGQKPRLASRILWIGRYQGLGVREHVLDFLN